MDFISTRDPHLRKTVEQAMLAGLAEDGGLFVPAYFPQIDLTQFPANLTYPEFAEKILALFFTGELKKALPSLCKKAFTFPIPTSQLNENTFMLELFHGPTLSFKDIGARFLAECLNALSQQQKITIMVATSGDTGSAVASAFYEKNNTQIIILYPEGQISARQQQQITCWDKNVIALAVKGTFDDCQKLVKSAFQDPWWQKHTHLSSANSINIGRLLPQITYYAFCSMQFYHQYGTKPGFIVPTGNLGNATACYWARAMGFPIREIALSTNENKVIPDYLQSGNFQPRKSIATLANAMDVGNPSNFERMQYLYNHLDDFKNHVQAISASDEDIKKTIKHIYSQYGKIICPHTATACFARQQLSNDPWIVVATADPSKFESVIEPLIQAPIPVPSQLQELLDRPAQIVSIEPRLDEIQKVINEYFPTTPSH